MLENTESISRTVVSSRDTQLLLYRLEDRALDFVDGFLAWWRAGDSLRKTLPIKKRLEADEGRRNSSG
jgi:hypothetical protein